MENNTNYENTILKALSSKAQQSSKVESELFYKYQVVFKSGEAST